MTDNGQLSPLAKAYLQYMEEIEAGYNAFGDDIGWILREVGRQARDQVDDCTTVDVGEDFVRRVWYAPPSHVPVVLRLQWNKDMKYPVVKVNDNGDASTGEFSVLFSADLFRACHPRSACTDGLLENALQECLRLWNDSVKDIERFITDEAFQYRARGLYLMKLISDKLIPRLKEKLPSDSTIVPHPGITGHSGSDWPCFIQWQVPLVDGGYFDLVFNPNMQGAQGYPHRGVQLVLYGGKKHLHTLQDFTVCGTYLSANNPVLSHWLDALDTNTDLSEMAGKIAEGAMQTSMAVLNALTAHPASADEQGDTE